MLYWHRYSEFTAATAVFLLVGGFLLFILFTASRQQSWDDKPIPAGRIVVAVPAYNEDPFTLHACIRSLLNQTCRIDAIYVVDDGSPTPAPVLRDPRVHWKRTKNGGKRHAQAVGLIAEEGRADFIVSVDSDSVVAPDGVEKLLRAFSDPRIQAAAGLPVLRNRAKNLITRLTDMEIVYGCLTLRRARSALGAVLPTSGAFAAYRAEIFFDNVTDYLSSGTYGDDRRLTHYALQRGRVVSVDDAVVETDMPTTPRAVFKQRTRWFKGSFRYMPWELRNLKGAPIAFRLWNLSMFLAYPIFIVHSLAIMPLTGRAVDLTPLLYWLTLLYVQSFTYVIGRKGVSLVERLLSWLFLTPLVSVFQMLLIRPAMYYATTQVRSDAWATRGAPAESGSPLVPVPSVEAVRAAV
ncbi:glycosyltransferase family 2 protein [Actinopolymorpha pittospori]|uniref:Hyaluronan synthase n=1 Tax=Actinopolymorpha pittospori TaxID=648752 RepID=A0A927RHN5_9ACTN|nr:glycosyltransferase family 2 protein [Actinopolymorpha pittospori]MBE1603663.1 hyaluronan synthase [Actinopolymorpha pittospori]